MCCSNEWLFARHLDGVWLTIRIHLSDRETNQLQIVSEQQCVAYANGRINAIVIDFGLTSVRVAIVINGAILDGSLIQINVGGRDVTDYQMTEN